MKYTKNILGSFFATLTLFAIVLSPVFAVDSTVVVTGNTTNAENTPGWMFNRDIATDTPFEFNNSAASIGSGSLYVQPIGNTAADKFIGENFVNTPITNVNSISYDFKIGSGGVDTEEEQFYMNVYANFGVSDDLKFYDCRYNVVPTVGSTAGFTTVTFDPMQAYPVTTRTGAPGTASPFTCPAIPAEMNLLSDGSNIRVFALNVGDTSTSDEGLDGYLDKVIVNLDSGVTTYDFEMYVAPSVPVITTPSDGAIVATSALTEIDWNDSTPGTYTPVEYQYQAFSDAGYTNLVYSSTWLNASEIPTPGAPVGDYYLQVRARDAQGNMTAWSNDAGDTYKITVVADPTPTPTVTPTPTPDPYAVPLACSATGNTYGAPIIGTEGSNKINGTAGNDLIFGLGGSDKIDGKGGNDCIVGGAGSNKIDGGTGNDVIIGGDDSDSLDGGSNDDKVYGMGGSDSLKGGSGNDELWGGNGNDALSGDSGNDTLRGEGGSDSAKGGSGNSDDCDAESEKQCEI